MSDEISVYAYRAVVYGTDFEARSVEEAREQITLHLEHQKYIGANVEKIDIVEIKNWEDEHPFNYTNTQASWFDEPIS